MCLYDEIYLCVCDLDRFANCFEFDHSMNYDCQGYNDFQNGGHCFQNNAPCLSKLICVCQDCFYSSRCQISMKGFTFSLDFILAYFIKPSVSFRKQSSIIKVSVALMTLMLVLSLINGSLIILTFYGKKPKQVGSIYYLLVSSIISICTVILLAIKFCQLVLSQMSVI